MALVKVYTPKGKPVLMEPVDARECVEHCGYSYEPPVEKPVEKNTLTGADADNNKDNSAADTGPTDADVASVGGQVATAKTQKTTKDGA